MTGRKCVAPKEGAHLWRCSWFDVLGFSLSEEKVNAEGPLTKMFWAGVHTSKIPVWHRDKVLISGRSEVWAKINTHKRPYSCIYRPTIRY